MNYYLLAFKKYNLFSGRAHREEYWHFIFVNIIIILGLGMIEGMLGIAPSTDVSILVSIYQLIIFIPSVSIGVRRMHDVNKSGWFLLIPIYNIILAITDGDEGNNKYGPDPKALKIN